MLASAEFDALRSSGSAGFSATRAQTQQSQSSPNLRTRFTARLPRQGAEVGGGNLSIGDRSIFEAFRDEFYDKIEEETDKTRRPTNGTRKRDRGSRKEVRHESATEAAQRERALQATLERSPDVVVEEGEEAEVRAASARPQVPQGPEARRRIELQTKWEKAEAIRSRDEKTIRERLEKSKQMRDERFKRLLHGTSDEGGLCLEVAQSIRERDAHTESRRRELHMDWDERVSQPICQQAFDLLNPPDRALQQRLMGSKSVSIRLPNQQFRLMANVAEDPARQSVVEHARENSFHQAACAVLSHSQSAPDILRRSIALDQLAGVSPGIVPRALSRPVLEPVEWNPIRLQGTPFGHQAQVCEYGVGFRSTFRQGNGVFLPDESDGIAAAGTRTTRETGHCDKGILRGRIAKEGLSADWKTSHGASSGAPGQDHYTYASTTRITDLEFPLGKRVFPQFH